MRLRLVHERRQLFFSGIHPLSPQIGDKEYASFVAAGAAPLPSSIRICPVNLGVRCSGADEADCAGSIIKKGCVLPCQGTRTLRLCPSRGDTVSAATMPEAVVLEVRCGLHAQQAAGDGSLDPVALIRRGVLRCASFGELWILDVGFG